MDGQADFGFAAAVSPGLAVGLELERAAVNRAEGALHETLRKRFTSTTRLRVGMKGRALYEQQRGLPVNAGQGEGVLRRPTQGAPCRLRAGQRAGAQRQAGEQRPFAAAEAHGDAQPAFGEPQAQAIVPGHGQEWRDVQLLGKAKVVASFGLSCRFGVEDVAEPLIPRGVVHVSQQRGEPIAGEAEVEVDWIEGESQRTGLGQGEYPVCGAVRALQAVGRQPFAHLGGAEQVASVGGQGQPAA